MIYFFESLKTKVANALNNVAKYISQRVISTKAKYKQMHRNDLIVILTLY
jgi:hypothetical protein